MPSRAAERRRRGSIGDADFAQGAALLADPARSAMVATLLDGAPHAVSELAGVAGVGLSTASEHVALLRAARLVEVTARGRLREVRLTRTEVVEAIGALARIAPRHEVRSLRGSERRTALNAARLCYDHLAGALGVELFDALARDDALTPIDIAPGARKVHAGLGDVELGPRATPVFNRLGIDLAEVASSTRRFATACLDWSHERPHLAGALGAALCRRFISERWVERTTETRALRITSDGQTELRRLFGIRL